MIFVETFFKRLYERCPCSVRAVGFVPRPHSRVLLSIREHIFKKNVYNSRVKVATEKRDASIGSKKKHIDCCYNITRVTVDLPWRLDPPKRAGRTFFSAARRDDDV